jgi:hypothetical protein
MHPKDCLPEFDFSLAEFNRHFSYYQQKTERMSLEMSGLYFARCYPRSAEEARYKLNRFMAIRMYLRAHVHEFEEFVVMGDTRKALIKDAFVAAVASYYLAIPEEFIRTEPERNYVVAETLKNLSRDRERESRLAESSSLTNLSNPARPDLPTPADPANSLHEPNHTPEKERI